MELWEGGRSFKEYLQVNKDNINFTDLMWRSLKLCLVSEKYEGKKIERKKWKERKNRFKINKLFLYIFSNSFNFISSVT